MEDLKEEVRFVKKWVYWLLGLILVISFVTWFLNRADNVVQTGIIRYEEFQEIYNSCDKLNTDLCNMESLPDTDVMFQQFSKAQRINTLKTSLNRWVQEYNAKSNMWTHSLWKSNKLPYQLSVTDFNCYQN